MKFRNLFSSGKKNKPLFDACKDGYYQDVESLLTVQQCNPNIKDGDGVTPLFYASLNGYSNIVELLIDKGAEINYSDDYSVLLGACNNGHIEVVKTLINKGADVNVLIDGETTIVQYLSLLPELDGFEIIALLISEGKNKKDIDFLISNLEHEMIEVRELAAKSLGLFLDEPTFLSLIKVLDLPKTTIKSLLQMNASQNQKGSNKNENTQPPVKDSKSLLEKDNIGTRCETEDRGKAFFATLFQKDPEPILFYFFDTKEKATEALLDVSCINIAKDSGKLICTEILTFGVFTAIDENNNKTWSALLAGNSLNKDLWIEAQNSFKKYGGKMRREDEPENNNGQQTKTDNESESDSNSVTFVEDIDLSSQGGMGSKEIYKAPNKKTALSFLKSQDASRPFFYIEIETPDGWVGKDKDGIYEFD